MSASAPGTTFIVLMLPFLAALVAPWLTRRLGHNAAWLLALAPAAIFIHFLGFSAEVADGGIVTGGFQWVPSFNVNFSWLIDGSVADLRAADHGHRHADRALFRGLPQGPRTRVGSSPSS
jgi:Na+/melibiose symporter-like transporter